MAGVPIPPSVDGLSLQGVMQGREVQWRDYLHGEHAEGYGPHQSNHYLTDGRSKFVWYTDEGREQFFNLDEDPSETRNLAGVPEHREEVDRWRRRLVNELKDRPEGFSDGIRLVAGKPHVALIPGIVQKNSSL